MNLKQKILVEINGKTYMSPGAAHDIWSDLSTQKIVAECKKGKVLGACLDSGNNWIIPIEAKQPILDENIRLFLVSILYIKNKTSANVDSIVKEQLISVLEYLKETGYIEKWDDDGNIDLTSVVLTDKGMDLATRGKKIDISLVNAGITLIQVVSSIITIWQAMPH